MFRLYATRSRISHSARRIVIPLIAATLLLVFAGLLRGVRPAFAGGSGYTQYVHSTTSANTSGDFTLLDNPVTNNNPNAIVSVTANWNPGGRFTNFDYHQVGVWYDTWAGKWSIFNEDLASMPIGASFNVYALPSPDGSANFVLTATVFNTSTSGYTTYILNPALNGNPNAHFLVTQNWNPGGSYSGMYNNHAIGVWYNSVNGRWAIVNEDGASLPVGASFNVVSPIGDAFTQVATSTNTAGNFTCMNDSLLNGNPNALAFIVHNATFGLSMRDVTGVWYYSYYHEWCIFDGSFNQMPLGTSFFVTGATGLQ